MRTNIITSIRFFFSFGASLKSNQIGMKIITISTLIFDSEGKKVCLACT